MSPSKTGQALPVFVAAAALVLTPLPALGEFSCVPANTSITYPVGDPFFATQTTLWKAATKVRYVEGTKPSDCIDINVPNYNGHPTKLCHYAEADQGKGVFPPLAAQAIVLNPSAEQMASWSVHACRTAGAGDKAMDYCLTKLHDWILNQNGAQFAIAGTVVESKCD